MTDQFSYTHSQYDEILLMRGDKITFHELIKGGSYSFVLRCNGRMGIGRIGMFRNGFVCTDIYAYQHHVVESELDTDSDLNSSSFVDYFRATPEQIKLLVSIQSKKFKLID